MNEEATLPPQRRSSDPRLEKLVEDISGVQGYVERLRVDVATARQRQEDMQKSIDENTSITNRVQVDVGEMKETVGQVRDAIASFKTLAVVGKWVSVMAAAVGSMVVAWKQIKGG